MHNRRGFLKIMAAGGAFAGLSLTPLAAEAKREMVKITILHTNDMHSRIDPFSQNDPKYPGMGGFSQRASLIKQIREKEKNVILLDAGDVFQGTPYFNKYGGELEFKLMSEMGYDAMTIGNHEFDNGLEGILNQMEHAKFPFISANYDFSETILAGKVDPYQIIYKEGIKVGIFGLGIELNGLVSKAGYGNTHYLDPMVKAAEMTKLLKKELKCDLVICLSHLGLSYKSKRVSDMMIAKYSKDIDLIVGGHTHSWLNKPIRFFNSKNEEVIIAQCGWAGLMLGKIDFYFSRKGEKKAMDLSTIKISENQV